MRPKLVDVAEESGREGPKCVPGFDEFRALASPSATDFRDWGSDFGEYEAVNGKLPPAIAYSAERERCPKYLDANGAEAHVAVAEICPFLDIWGAFWIWCIFDIFGLY